MLKHYVEFHRKEEEARTLWGGETLVHEVVEEKEVERTNPEEIELPVDCYKFQFYDRNEILCGPDGEEVQLHEYKYCDKKGSIIPTSLVELLQGEKKYHLGVYYIAKEVLTPQELVEKYGDQYDEQLLIINQVNYTRGYWQATLEEKQSIFNREPKYYVIDINGDIHSLKPYEECALIDGKVQFLDFQDS